MNPTSYHIIHVSAVLVLFGYTFYSFAAAPETRKKVLMITGIASLLTLFGGLGLVAKIYGNHFFGWMIVKFVAWLGLAALSGIGYRPRGATSVLSTIAVVLAVVAVTMVYLKPSF